MKRVSQVGGSPGPKIKVLADSDSDDSGEANFNFPDISDTNSDSFDFGNIPSQGSSLSTSTKFPSQFTNISSRPSSQPDSIPLDPSWYEDLDISSGSDTNILNAYYLLPSLKDEMIVLFILIKKI